MDNLHTWERVYFNSDATDRFTESVSRFRVPGGWLYMHSLTRAGWFLRDHLATVFVPDPAEAPQAPRAQVL